MGEVCPHVVLVGIEARVIAQAIHGGHVGARTMQSHINVPSSSVAKNLEVDGSNGGTAMADDVGEVRAIAIEVGEDGVLWLRQVRQGEVGIAAKQRRGGGAHQDLGVGRPAMEEAWGGGGGGMAELRVQ